MAVNKVIYGGNTLVDLTGDTVTATDLADGVKATGADGNPVIGLMQKVTIDAELSTTSTNPVQNKVIKAALDGKINKTDKIYEANLEWGGRDIAGGYSPIDGAMISNLGANRFAFGKVEGITVEYSEDAGETWVEYPLTDTAKVRLFSVGGNYLYAGGEKSRTPSVNDMIRVTIDSDAFGTYTALNKFAIEISTGGNRGCYCTIDASLESSPTAFKVFADKVPIEGWSGYNIINTQSFETYGNQPSRQYCTIRFTFGCTTVNTTYKGLAIVKIMGFGGVGWHTPSNMAQNGHLYGYNEKQEAVFPASITAPNFIGKVNGYTISTSVPGNAKFTDTVYTHPATHPASMITGLSTVATSGSYNDLTDKPTIPASATVDSELSSTSVNPVQNKVINAALNSKADSSALSAYLPLTGGTCTGSVSAPNFQTGAAADNYFQCRRFRGEGDANSYYHAIDFGYSGHDSVDFYEYDANWNFYKCLTGTKSGAVLVGNINGNGWNGGAQLTGTPTAPTAAVGTNTTQIATTAFVHSAIPTNVSSFTNDAGYLTQHQSLVGYVKSVNNTKPDSNGNVTITVSGGGVSTSVANDWSAQQYFYMAKFQLEKYDTSYGSGTTINPTAVTTVYNATGNLTLNLMNLTSLLSAGESIVFTAYITSTADYALTITNGGTVKYIGSPSDLAITSAGLLLNIFIALDNSGNKTSIVQASKLS